jgi:hypothetical protein
MSEEEILFMIRAAFEQHLSHAHDQNTPTIRDQFAMAVATGIHASDNGDPSRWPYTMDDPYEAIATAAYRHADAMMAARAK